MELIKKLTVEDEIEIADNGIAIILGVTDLIGIGYNISCLLTHLDTVNNLLNMFD